MRIYVCLVVTALIVAASAAQAQSPTPGPTTMVVIGCLERGGPGGFLIKDFRNGLPYRLEAKAETLDWHVGHHLEVHGVIQSGSSSDSPTLKVESVLYLSPTCSAPAPNK
jgi:hypothetical protein